MARIPSLRRLTPEQFKDLEWFPRLASPINRYMEETTSAFNKNLTINDNFAGAVREVLVDGNYPLKISWDQPTRPTVVLIGRVRRADGASNNLSAAFSLDWDLAGDGSIRINGIPGLTADSSNKYYINLVILTG